jgi:hypothetical protein
VTASTTSLIGPRPSALLSGIVSGGHVSNGYVFYGPDATYTRLGAKVFGQLLFCMALSVDEGQLVPCGACVACDTLHSDGFVNFYEVSAEKSISIDRIRDLHRFVQFGPHQHTRMCVVIYDAHTMSVEASNAFLKTLEEPPSGVTFVLTTFHPSRLLPTILSRCQMVEFSGYASVVDDELASFAQYVEMIVSDRFRFNEKLAGDKGLLLRQLSHWMSQVKDSVAGGDHRHLFILKEIVEIISRLEYNLNHRLQLDALAVMINE